MRDANRQRGKLEEGELVLKSATTERVPFLAKTKPEARIARSEREQKRCDGPQSTADLVFKNLIVFGSALVAIGVMASLIMLL
jgi:hypothetical protein